MVAIETVDLSRNFKALKAVQRLNLSINDGEIFGLLGPNASGKSTTIRMLAGIIRPSAGTARILNMDLVTQTEQIKPYVGYVAQHFSLYPDLSATENLQFYGSLYGVDEPERVKGQLMRFELNTFANTMAGQLSGGYQRRLAIACATVHDPKLIFLDEPTAGIDPVTRKELWDLFYDLSADGKTLFVTTHYMEEAERCTRLGFLSHGKLITSGRPSQILNTLNNHCVYSAEIPYDPLTTQKIVGLAGVLLVNQFGNELRIVTDQTANRERLYQLISKALNRKEQLKQVKPTIEDAFMVLTKDNGSK